MSLTARPTEYKNVVFKSKTEAIFARNLDLIKCIWEYEPRGWRAPDGWMPDFWVVWQGGAKNGIPFVWSAIIEVKPSGPTETYKVELVKRFDSMGSHSGAGNHVMRDLLMIACVNPFDLDAANYMEFWANGEWNMVANPWLFNGIREAKNYRFDLLQ